MKLSVKNSALLVALLSTTTDAFVTSPSSRVLTPASKAFMNSPMTQPSARSIPLFATTESATDEEIERLRSMAQKLRAEAAALEAERAQELAEAAEKAFRKFDTNQDGEISLAELKAGLEKTLKTELPEDRVKKLMEDFDASGDGSLQLEEFVGVEKFINRLESLTRDEKAIAQEKAKAAKLEEEASKFLQAQLELINDKPPTNTEKLVSILPYLFPLLDGLQYARFLIVENPDNPVAIGLATLYALYRSVPFSGFIAFFALSFLSGNPRINRLIRFNMQQAIYLDIALFFPGLVAGLYNLVASGAGFQLPASITEVGSDALFVTLLATIGYATVSSLLGATPDKIPFISQATLNRMPTIDMFDAEGHLKNRQDDEEKKD